MSPSMDLRLGYVGIEARDLDAWERLGREVIGFHTERRDGLLLFRMDDHARRFVIWEGPLDDVAWLGWEANDTGAWQRWRERLGGRNVAIADIGSAGLKTRAVDAAFSFKGPAGLPCEICAGPAKTAEPLSLNGISGFVAGDLGLGHIALLTNKAAKTRQELEALLGARHTDDIVAKFQSLDLELNFFHVNPRHHSIAIGQFKDPNIPLPPKRLAHIAIEVAKLEDVGAVLVRAKSRQCKLGMDLGQHPNDRATSFYVVTPSGFEIEIAWGCVTIEDEAKWRPAVYDQFSLWGHVLQA